jgi:hypothetical protein
MKWYVVIVNVVGFYVMDLPITPVATNPIHTAVVLVDDARALLTVTEEGLKKLVNDNWDWMVRKLSESEYSVVFSNESSLCLKSATGLTLPGSKISMVIAKSVDDPNIVGSLFTI